jgi:hypothetical protein
MALIRDVPEESSRHHSEYQLGHATRYNAPGGEDFLHTIKGAKRAARAGPVHAEATREGGPWPDVALRLSVSG